MAVAVLLIVIAAGCGQDGGSPSITATAEPSPEVSPSPAATREPSPVATVTPPAGVRLAVPPENYSDFLESLGASFDVDSCLYDRKTALVDCSQLGMGKLILDPPFPSDRAECGIHIRDGEPVAVNCRDLDSYRADLYQVLP